MNKVIYNQRKRHLKLDDNHYIVYLSEKREPLAGVGFESEHPTVEGYAYTGEAVDGGTVIEATEATYPAFVCGLIRRKYPADTVEAINANRITALTMPEHERAADYISAYNAYQDFRMKCKDDAKYLLDMMEPVG